MSSSGDISRATEYKTPVSICMGNGVLGRIWIILHPLSLSGCPGTALIRSGGAIHYSRRDVILYRASPQIGPGQGFKENKQRTHCAENTGYASLGHKSRKIGCRSKIPPLGTAVSLPCGCTDKTPTAKYDGLVESRHPGENRGPERF